MSRRVQDKHAEDILESIGQAREKCPFEFNFDVEISPNDPTDPDRRMHGTRESRSVVSAAAALD